MAKPDRLGSIRTLANTAEMETSKIVAERRLALDAEEQRLAQLQTYLTEYAQTGDTQTGLSIDSMRNRRRFIDKIRGGIEEQERVVVGLRQQLETDLANWRDARSHALALEKYQHRQQAEEALRQSRREQAELDEIGRGMHANA